MEGPHAGVRALNRLAMLEAEARLNDITKPVGSLGLMEQCLVRLAGMTGHSIPRLDRPAALLFAADHGVSQEGISAYDSDVTEQMVVNICMGSAVSSVLSRAQGIPLTVVDVGVKNRVRHPAAVVRKVAPGTRNMAVEPAMTREQAKTAVTVGLQMAEKLIASGHDCLVLGEMGIGNTTSSSTMIAVMLGMKVHQVVGQGTGLDLERQRYKEQRIAQIITDRAPNDDDPWDIMTKVGGFEIASLAGAVMAGAKHGVPVLLDGFITATAALFACRVCPGAEDFLLASHCSAEPAHAHVLDALGLTPLLTWGMRLGEGSGALTVLPMVRNACTVFAETATFTDARVHRSSLPRPSSLTDLQDPVSIETSSPPTPVDFTEDERSAVYKVIAGRRDIRAFLPNPIPQAALSRILWGGHHGPSVGYMQPWNFIVIQDKAIQKQIQVVVEAERVRAAENYTDLKQEYYLRLKIEGLLQAPITICVTNDGTRGGPHVLGRNTIPETDLMSTACAIENMWLAARAEGIGMGWVSFYQKDDVRKILNIPDHIDPVALLSVGYTAHFPDIPLLERVGWGKRMELSSLIFSNRWGQREANE